MRAHPVGDVIAYMRHTGLLPSGLNATVLYTLPTTNSKTFVFANVPGAISDIAFINGDPGFSVTTQYTQGIRTVSAATVCLPHLPPCAAERVFIDESGSPIS